MRFLEPEQITKIDILSIDTDTGEEIHAGYIFKSSDNTRWMYYHDNNDVILEFDEIQSIADKLKELNANYYEK